MPTCSICLDALKDPASLPCGHVFCHGCIIRVVRNITPYTNHHFCPSCKHPYVISQVDPALVPPHLSAHVCPAIRKLHLDFTSSLSNPIPLQSATDTSEADRLRAEIGALKTACAVWRKRAMVHGTATLGLVGLAKLARDSALKMKAERDELEKKYTALKKTFEQSQALSTLPPTTTFVGRSAFEDLRESSFRPPSPSPSETSYCSDCPECRTSSSPKRKRSASVASHSSKRARSESSSPRVKHSPVSPSLGMAALEV